MYPRRYAVDAPKRPRFKYWSDRKDYEQQEAPKAIGRSEQSAAVGAVCHFIPGHVGFQWSTNRTFLIFLMALERRSGDSNGMSFAPVTLLLPLVLVVFRTGGWGDLIFG